MNLLRGLEAYRSSNVPVALAADAVAKYARKLEDGKITRQEYDEFVRDATRLNMISKDAEAIGG